MISKANVACILDAVKLANFDCGVTSVNEFLSTTALLEEQQHRFSTTIFFDTKNGNIIGYYTLIVSTVEIRNAYDFASFAAMGQTMSAVSDVQVSLPAVEIAWFAVDQKFQSQDYGHRMMADLFTTIFKLRYDLGIGIIGVTVAALPNAQEFYSSFGFQYLHADYDQIMAFPKTYPLFIHISKISDIVLANLYE